MAEYNKQISNWVEWDSNKLSKYLGENGVPGSYSEMFITNNINGETAASLTESHLKEMGVNSIGDRVKIINALETLKKAKAIANNNRDIWKGEAVLFNSNLSWACKTCCGCCPTFPDKYVLTNNHLTIKTEKPTLCPCMPCIVLKCLAVTKSTDSTDLSKINDVDFKNDPPSCFGQVCLGERVIEKVIIKTDNEGTKILILRKKVGEEAAKRIKQQVEVAQRMERS
mmetsp:Transcript_1445/g.3128  ORF Transcript_1445/g.3128 Transcript_1445/m.3128 type:complete len:226 (+) Transcript_1445:128-805(+)|eukprot:CAMPEP_0194304546 /NCGR_PEP_ID=MMETSP0171-20130528/2274_1 /TAXON_ID=218684 /ORGANISM="Corethron pennatum, Strain L29A3" /LENGTH=225 /DNA_ID=CAMNT_0039055865 /DNA_START=74 /DNA_END=751 /DNA_ORIENTATION=-